MRRHGDVYEANHEATHPELGASVQSRAILIFFDF